MNIEIPSMVAIQYWTITGLSWTGLALIVIYAFHGFLSYIRMKRDMENPVSLLRANWPGLKGWVAISPFLLFSSVCYPFIYLTELVYIGKFVIQHPKYIKSTKANLDRIVLNKKVKNQPPLTIFAIITAAFPFFLFYLSRQTVGDPLPLKLWLWISWLSYLIWIINARIGPFSLSWQLLVDSEQRLVKAILLSLLILVAFPLLSALIYLDLANQIIDDQSLFNTTIRIYSLNGVVWDGAQSTFSLLQTDPNSAILLASGFSIYAGLLYGACFNALKKPTDDERIALAQHFVNLGSPERALKQLRCIRENSMERVILQAAAYLSQGRLDTAIDFVTSNKQLLPMLSSNAEKNTLIIIVLKILKHLVFPAEMVNAIVDKLIAFEFTEDELLIVLMELETGAPDLKIAENERLKDYAEVNRFLYVGSVLESESQNKNAKALLERCGLSPQLHLMWAATVFIRTPRKSDVYKARKDEVVACISASISGELSYSTALVLLLGLSQLSGRFSELGYTDSSHRELIETIQFRLDNQHMVNAVLQDLYDGISY